MPPPSKERKAVLDLLDSGGSLADAKTLLDTFLAKNPSIAEKEHVQHALGHIDTMIALATAKGEQPLLSSFPAETIYRLRRILQYDT